MSSRLRRYLLTFAVVTASLAPPASALAAESARPPGDARPPKPGEHVVTVGERAAAYALQAVGIPYRWGGESPATGFDCSGLVRWAYLRFGIDLPHSSYALATYGRSVPRSRLEPGDVLVFSGLGHVGLYIGEGRMVHAPQSGRNVEVVVLDRSYYGARIVSARRVS
jgi:cell wall-associated NlpC family hydrolase